MYPERPYRISTSGTAIRVQRRFWQDCPENRELIQRMSQYLNGDITRKREAPLGIIVDDAGFCVLHMNASEAQSYFAKEELAV